MEPEQTFTNVSFSFNTVYDFMLMAGVVLPCSYCWRPACSSSQPGKYHRPRTLHAFNIDASITRVSLTVVPNIFVLNIARWGVREFCIAIVAVNSAALRPSMSLPCHLRCRISYILRLLTMQSVSRIVLEKGKACTTSPAEAQQLRLCHSPTSTRPTEWKTTRQSGSQLYISWYVDNRCLHTARAWR